MKETSPFNITRNWESLKDENSIVLAHKQTDINEKEPKM